MERKVIASDVGGIGEIIEDSKTGLLIKSRDTESIVESVKALSDDIGLTERISQNAVNVVKSRFSVRRMPKLYERTYRSMFKKPQTH